MSTVTMECKVLWNPKLEMSIIWKKDNKDIDVNNGGRFSVNEDNGLVIKDLKMEDTGKKKEKNEEREKGEKEDS